MTTTPDVVVVGAGSNSLVTAAYLAKAGKNVLVLEKNDQCGGGVVSIEIAPGFVHDPHASGYYLCIASPAIQHDELGLMSKFGLEWRTWEAGFGTIFDTGDSLIAYADLDRTCEDIARFSQKDAETYRRFAKECKELLPLLSKGGATPPLPTGPFITMLESSARGRRLVDMMFQSAYDILENLFESTELRIHMMKWAAEAMEGPEVKGTGAMLVGLFGLAHSYKAHIPVGGSRAVTNALIRCIEHYGGTVRTLAEVARVNVRGGRAAGVTLSTGETIEARDGVVGCIHPWRLGELIPEVDRDIAAAARQVKLSNHGALNQQIALSEWPKFKVRDEERWSDVLCIEYVRKDELSVRKVFDQYKYGEIPTHLSPLTMMNSRKDPSRAPSPDHCALYLYHFAPRVLVDGGIEGWDKHRQAYADAIWEEYKTYTTNIDDSKIIARHIESPLEHHHHSASMMHGDIFGIGTTMGQNMGRRPIPELAQFRVPGLDAFYLVGPFMHPGGTVNFGGRATAMRMMMDWKMDLNRSFVL
ncbi:NAD(P)/FAD-dependent oxidoreductase [Paraburkholderia sacchari]|uniref:phytoene desaturase family protein n=1 Tax=Paraburkholderia sacchari TaxID=159450 RepID=UPI0039A62166